MLKDTWLDIAKTSSGDAGKNVNYIQLGRVSSI